MDLSTDRVGPGKYDALYRRSTHTLFGSGPSKFVEAFLPIDQCSVVLDIGCGEGRNARWMAERGVSVVAIDVSSLALARATTYADVSSVSSASSGSVAFINGDCRNLPLAGTFDAVIAYGIFHCIGWRHVVALFSWIMRHLTASGVFIGAVLTDGLPIFDGHGTGALHLRPATAYLKELSRMYCVAECEVAILEEQHDEHMPLHAHEILRFVASPLSPQHRSRS